MYILEILISGVGEAHGDGDARSNLAHFRPKVSEPSFAGGFLFPARRYVSYRIVPKRIPEKFKD